MTIDKRFNIAAYLGRPFNRDTVKVTADYDGNLTIVEWNEPEAQPTQEQLDNLEAEANALETLEQVYLNRKKEYPSIEECVHAILDDDLENLQILRQAVKDKFPKENA